MADANALKAEGNKAIAEKNFDLAIEKFTQAIELDPSNHVLYSNRSAAHASKKDYENALADAEKVVEIKPDWPKGWSRKGTAAHGLGDLVKASDAYEEGLKLAPEDAGLKSGLASVKRAIEAEARADGAPGDNPLGNIFNDPGLIQKLMMNPKTRDFLKDPSFMAKLQQMRTNPQASQDIFSDPRMLQVMGVAMGVDIMSGADAMGNMGGEAGASRGEAEEDIPMPDARPSSSNPEPKKEPTPEPDPQDEEAIAKKKAKEEADAEKKLGTDAYKKRNFDEAIAHYSKAWELYKDITYLNNLGAAKYEKGDYQGAIEACNKAIEEGREIYADFKMIAKSYARIGNAYEKLGDYPNAIDSFKKSLMEHRTPEVVKKLREVENRQIEEARLAYIDPEKAEEAREEGNAKFKDSDWPGAVAAYTEMIKRAPEDPRGYSNRAAAFIKLLEFPSAIEDCDKALKKDPKFIRAYIRKAQAYFGSREYSKCLEVCDEALTVTNSDANKKEIEQQQAKALSAMYSARSDETEEQTKERIQRDPQIMNIMQDPVMQSILQQAQNDPAALNEHMKNPSIKSKINMLISAGVIKVGR